MNDPTHAEPEPEPPTEPALGSWHGPEPSPDPWQAFSPAPGVFGPEPQLSPPEPPPYREPWAVAVANGSLFSVGYVMLGRRLLAVTAWLVTVVLLVVLATVQRSVWFESVVLGWWVLLVVHGGFLARRRNTRHGLTKGRVRRQWVGALAATLPVLLLVTLLRLDAAGISQDVADAQRDGDCGRATSALDERWAGNWVADAPLMASGDVTVWACRDLLQAKNTLDYVLDGNPKELQTGLDGLRNVLTRLPGHEKMVEHVLDGFLGHLPTASPCDTADITDQLGRIRKNGTVMDHIAATVPKVAPAALVACGDTLMAAQQWQPARARYQQLLDEYPKHKLAPKATDGVHRATLAIELDIVRGLLGPSGGAQPAYCTKPAPYSGAVPYTAGTGNPSLMYGATDYISRLPAWWQATDAANAITVLCAGEPEFGAAVRTCGYDYGIGYTQYQDITFHNVAIPVRVYELKTARVVADVRLEIGGASCPDTVSYTSIDYIDVGPPSDMYVTPSDAEVQAAFWPLFNP